MTGWFQTFKRQFAELQHRRVIRTVATYLVVSWLLLQIADVTFEPLGLPVWSQRALIIALAAGLVPVAVLAWIFDLRSGKIVRTESAVQQSARLGSTVPALPEPVVLALPEPVGPASMVASVAILPFTDLSQARDQGWFCDGLAVEILDCLAGVRGLRVASRSASFRFRDGTVDPREIGRLLCVDAILEGSVRKMGEGMKISVQLIDTREGYQLWSKRFDRPLSEVMVIQDEIAHHVAEALRLSLQDAPAGRFQRHVPRNVEAYEYYLRGRQLMAQISEINWRRASPMFRRAIELDPDYPQAQAGLADNLVQLAMWRYVRTDEVINEAGVAAGRALTLAPDLAEAHVAQGNLCSLKGDNAGAVRAFERAIELNPGLHDAWYYYARHAFAHGDVAHAAELYLAAYRTRPDDHVVLALAITALDASGQTEKSNSLVAQVLDGLRRQVELDPDNPRPHYFLASAYQRNGQTEAGRVHAEAAMALRPDEFPTLYNVACFYSLGGEIDKALDLLERAVRTGNGYPEWIRNDSDFAALRTHPRFQALLEQIH